jgi:hypothetical protein
MRDLPIPPIAAADSAAIEIARIGVAGGGQHVSLATQIWDDPAAWGMMLVDLARHVANAYSHTQGKDRSETLARIREGFDAEWESPTDEPKGSVTDPPIH